MSLDIDREDLSKIVTAVWSLITEAHIHEAKETVERLLLRIQKMLSNFDSPPFSDLENLAHAYHAAGYTASMCVRNPEAFVALQYFEEMKSIADTLHNDTLSMIALSYKGDTYRRVGNIPKALNCLQSAHSAFPSADCAARGNCAQLLGRIYFRLNDLNNFEQIMKEAEQIALAIDQVDNSLHGQYCLGTVYIDYARSYNQLGQFQRSLEYLQQAEAAMPSSPHWQTLLTATRGMLLVKSGDIQTGMLFVTKAVELGYEHGNQRLLDRLYGLRNYFDERVKEISSARKVLDEALDRSLEF